MNKSLSVLNWLLNFQLFTPNLLEQHNSSQMQTVLVCMEKADAMVTL